MVSPQYGNAARYTPSGRALRAFLKAFPRQVTLVQPLTLPPAICRDPNEIPSGLPAARIGEALCDPATNSFGFRQLVGRPQAKNQSDGTNLDQVAVAERDF